MSLVKVFANIVRCFDTIFHPDIPIGRGLNYQICYLGPYQTSSFSFPLWDYSYKNLARQDDSLICDIDCHPFNWFEFEHMSCVGGPKYILFPLLKKPNKKGREL